MARNKSSLFGAADGLFSGDNVLQQESFDYTHEVHEIHDAQVEHKVQNAQEKNLTHEEQKVHETQEAQAENVGIKRTLGSTQGRKGEKLKRINLAFDDVNYEYVRIESRRRGKNITEFINAIIEDYRVSEKGRISDSEIR